MFRSTRLKITDLNPHLSCILCGGYFIDATTITECLHSFCRACIVRYLETSRYCPVCEVQVHKSRPLHYIRSDKTLQDIVYKLVPGLFHNEMKRRRELYASQPPEALKESRDSEDRGECLDEKFIYASDEIFSLSIEYGKEAENQENAPEDMDDNVPKRRFLRCPAAITVSHLKKFIRMKYGIPNSYEIDLIYDKESLLDEYTLMDVAYIYLWQRRGPMKFFYKIMEKPKKLKTEHSYEQPNVEMEDPAAQPKSEVKSESETTETVPVSPVQAVTPQQTTWTVKQETCAEAKPKRVVSVSEPVSGTESADLESKSKTESPTNKPPVAEPSEKKEMSESPLTVTISSKKDSKSTSFKFPSSTSSKGSNSDNKPAVMTVAPLTKPSTSQPTTSTTAATGTVTHGLYTGISIKKSPPNTLPPFRISSHLLPPRVPPLKLSPPRFSRLESCLRQMSPKETSSSSKKSSMSKKSKSSRCSSDKLESKVAQLKSASIKCVAPLVISVLPESKVEDKKSSDDTVTSEKKTEESVSPKPPPKEPSPPKECPPAEEPKVIPEDDKMDLDSDLFEGPLVIAEPDIMSKEDSENSESKLPDVTPKEDQKEEDPEDEEIDVVDDGEVDSGRGSDISSRAEARSLCGDDDLGSPESVPKTPDAERPPPSSLQSTIAPALPESKPITTKCNGVTLPTTTPALTNGNSGDCGVLDLSTCSRKRSHDGESPVHRSKQVANPAVLDKTRQTPCRSPEHPSFKVLSAHLPHVNIYKKPETSSRGFKSRGNTLTVFNPDPNGNRPKLVIKNLGPRLDRSQERFHHHHHNHHHHHQRM